MSFVNLCQVGELKFQNDEDPLGDIGAGRGPHVNSEYLSGLGPIFSQESDRIAWVVNSNLICISPIISEGSSDKMSTIRTKDIITCLEFARAQQSLSLSWRKNNHHDLLLITGFKNGHIRIYDGNSATLLTHLISHNASVSALQIMPSHNQNMRIISASTDKTLKIWDMERNGFNMSLTLSHSNPLLCVSWSPNTQLVATAGTGRILYIYDVYQSGDDHSHLILKHKLLRSHLDNIIECVFSSDSCLLATASWDTRVHIWNVDTGTIKITLCHTDPTPLLIFTNHVKSLSMSRCGTYVSTVTSEGFLNVWNISNFNSSQVFNIKPVWSNQNINSILTNSSMQGNYIATCDSEKKISIFNLITSPCKLIHLARLEIRKRVQFEKDLMRLNLPTALTNYLKYNS